VAHRIGILGGSYNPVHTGHLKIAETILDTFPIEKCLLMPNFYNPHKGKIDGIQSEDRVKMLQIALEEIPRDLGIEFSSFEIDQKTTCYTIDTLKHFSKQRQDTLFIMGADNFQNIPSWKGYRELFEVSDIAVISRPSHTTLSLQQMIPPTISFKFKPVESDLPEVTTLKHDSGKFLYFVPMKPIPISSHQLRTKISEGKDASQYIPGSVLKYIYDHRLYTA